jgi:hypothetical protein
MGLQHYTQDMSKIPLKYNKKVSFYTKIHTLRLSVGGRTDGRMDARTDGRTDGWKIFTQYSGISSCSMGSTYICNECNVIFINITINILLFLEMCIKISLIYFIMKSSYVIINYKLNWYHYNIPLVIQQHYCYL